MQRGKLLRAFYYTALLENDDYSPIRPLVDWLHYNGFTMVTKPAKEFTDASGRRKVKGNMDIELNGRLPWKPPRMWITSSFSPATAISGRWSRRFSARACGCRCVSTIRSQPPMIAE